jgi:hypothetical protein
METIKTVRSSENIDYNLNKTDFIAYCENCECAAIVLDEEELSRNSLIEWHRNVDLDCAQTLELYSNKESIKTARGSLQDGVRRLDES